MLSFDSPRWQPKQVVLSATVQKWKREKEQKWTEWPEGKVSEARGPDGGGSLLVVEHEQPVESVFGQLGLALVVVARLRYSPPIQVNV
jgi:hypothetical protein